MINHVSLQNFKCYQEETHFDLKQINLLTGINGKGKSTFLQSILLIGQSQRNGFMENWRDYLLMLNGSFVRLGTFDDVRNVHSPRNKPISFQLAHSIEDLSELAEFQGIKKNFRKMRYQCNPTNDESILAFKDDESKHPTRLTESLIYVSADRLGPQEFYEKINMARLQVGKKGEYTAQVLAKAQKSQLVVNQSLALSKNRLLVPQVGEWIGHILGNPNVSLVIHDNNRYTISLTFKMGTKEYTMPNVGFGYSYILPIIVSGLIAKPNEILIIENPEAHLHPRAQSRLAHFLAKVAKTGVQVFIESHSDHILNALRVAVKNKDLTPDDLQIFYFAENQDDDAPHIFTPQIDTDGRIDEWPDGFFDEWNNNLMELL
jgi:predicted ATPase